jgi:hypothetical protein
VTFSERFSSQGCDLHFYFVPSARFGPSRSVGSGVVAMRWPSVQRLCGWGPI